MLHSLIPPFAARFIMAVMCMICVLSTSAMARADGARDSNQQEKAAPDEAAILETVDAFFLALASGDADAIARLQSPSSVTVTVYPEADRPVRYGDGAALIDQMRGGDFPEIVEPYWSPTVLQRHDLAVVWTPYQVSVDGKLIHCGIDVFNLTRHGGQWKIDAVSWTAEPSACDELQPTDKSIYRPKF